METPNLHLPQEVIALMSEKGAKLNRWGNVMILNDLRVAGFTNADPSDDEYISIRLMQNDRAVWSIEFSAFVPAEVIVAALNAIL